MMSTTKAMTSKLLEKIIEARVSKIQSGQLSEKVIPFAFSLEPTIITCECLNSLNKATFIWQKLLHLASLDSSLIETTLAPCKNEQLVGKLLQVFLNKQIAEKQKHKPKIDLCRCDYFFDHSYPKLIEYNTSCVSMAGIGSKLQEVYQEQCKSDSIHFPNNYSRKTCARSICDFYKKNSLSGIFLLVMLPGQANVNDQNILLEEIQSMSIQQNLQPIKCKKVIYNEFMDSTQLNCNDDLIYQHEKVGIVYFRAGYSTKTGIRNDIKIRIGRSSAVSIPWIGSQLINTKRMQIQLSKQQVMKKFLSQQEIIILRSTIIQAWDFSPPRNEDSCFHEIIEYVQSVGKDKFVLKPNQEGGSNNFFGLQAYQKLISLSKQQRISYVLTRLLKPQILQLSIIRAKNSEDYSIKKCLTNSQYSIYGSIISNSDGTIYSNTADGFIVRSKPIQFNEGGLIAGNGVVSALATVPAH